ncbi:hypothetical protein LCGC14_2216320 [marine sediment metagenome]|uniref:Uncharacterized protein n=1 Tax=marine sediment metagenome TaxID=412755 RepID=A0A0F9DCA5_9ZZZZ
MPRLEVRKYPLQCKLPINDDGDFFRLAFSGELCLEQAVTYLRVNTMRGEHVFAGPVCAPCGEKYKVQGNLPPK